jgi:hypothetical protein
VGQAFSLDLPRRQSAFLWGARKTGKSTLLRTACPQSLTYDFLKTDLALSFGARPAVLPWRRFFEELWNGRIMGG